MDNPSHFFILYIRGHCRNVRHSKRYACITKQCALMLEVTASTSSRNEAGSPRTGKTKT